MPANTGIDDARTSGLYALGKGDDLFPRAAVVHQVEHGQAVDEDELRTDRFAALAYDFNRQLDAVFVASTPAIGALIGARRDELIDEIALASHYLDAVVASRFRLDGAVHKVADGALDAAIAQGTWLEWADGGLQRRRTDSQRVVAVAPGVENLHGDASASFVHSVGDVLVLEDFVAIGQLGCERLDPAGTVWSDTAGHNEPNVALCSARKVRRHLL